MKAPNKIEFQTWIKNGKWTTNTSIIKAFNEVHNNSLITITLHKKKNKRSNKQNKYYWSAIVPIVNNCIKEEWGELWSIERTHEFLLTNCNYEELVNEDTGEILRRTRRTTENSTTQQEDYHEKCRRLVKDFFNTEIPLPNEDLKLKFK